MDEKIDALRAVKKKNIPAVMTREETSTVLSLMTGTPQLVAKLLYGSGLRISEAIRLRVQDIDYHLKTLTVRPGKGNKDKVTTFPAIINPLLKNHLSRVKITHQKDLRDGYGAVYLPHALARKYPNAAKEWNWQYVFPANNRSKDPRSNCVRRHHINPIVAKVFRAPKSRRRA